MIKHILLTLFITATFTLTAQNELEFICGYNDGLNGLLKEDKHQTDSLLKMDYHYAKSYDKNKILKTTEQTYIIPVVVHVVHSGEPIGSLENPSDAQIQAYLDEATLRFRNQHSGAGTYTNPYYGADTKIQLCLSQFDPMGNATTGILRYFDPSNTSGTIASLANALNPLCWDKTQYCNLILVRTMTGAAGVYIGGSWDFTMYTANAFGGPLMVHELGHYFSLPHTFGGTGCVNNNCLLDGDKVCDTPPKYNSSGTACLNNTDDTCTTDEDDTSNNNPYRPIALGGLGNQLDNRDNHMDYGCWKSFTLGQKDRMRFNIDNSRSAMKNNSMTTCDIFCYNTILIPASTNPSNNLYQASNKVIIETTAAITPLNLHAGNCIEMNFPFEIPLGVQYKADIQPCGTLPLNSSNIEKH